ncbi:MAG: enoyl-CoA hydratase-related protein [Thermoplasmatota archaeon]
MADSLLLVNHDRGVTTLTLNRPDVHNCVNGALATELAQAITAFGADAAARVLIVTGSGAKAFCSGADLKDAMSLLRHPWVDRAGPMGFARLDPGKPTIAAVNGYCFAGGFELAAWCDFRIAEPQSEFGCLSRRWGVPYTDGGTQRFARIIGQGNALYLLETGMRIDAHRAYEMGFIQEIVPRGTSLSRAQELACAIAGYPNPTGIRADRAGCLATWGLSLPEGLRFEAQHSLPTVHDPEMATALKAYAAHERPDALRPPENKESFEKHASGS